MIDVQETTNLDVEMEIDHFQIAPTTIELKGVLFKEWNLVLNGFIVVWVHHKYEDDALENAILGPSHIDAIIIAH